MHKVWFGNENWFVKQLIETRQVYTLQLIWFAIIGRLETCCRTNFYFFRTSMNANSLSMTLQKMVTNFWKSVQMRKKNAVFHSENTWLLSSGDVSKLPIVYFSFFKDLPQSLQCRDTGNDLSFPDPFPFLKINNNYEKSFLNGYPKIWSQLFSFPGTLIKKCRLGKCY